ncbi:MAG: hypothetical protein HQL79_07670 [Magnetococcales bacterium]|nr:hypothetical protein [Magnetococcales bacterium]
MLISCACFWVWYQSQPITTNELVQLNALIAQAAKARQLPPQRVRADLWRQFSVRETSGLTHGQHGAALAYLLAMAK